MENNSMNKYLVVFQFPDGEISNRILNAEKLTEDVVIACEAGMDIDKESYVTILNIIKLDE